MPPTAVGEAPSRSVSIFAEPFGYISRMEPSAPVEIDETLSTASNTAVSDNAAAPSEEFVADELLVEEISIDGMCGVY